MNTQKLVGLTRKMIDEYGLIDNGDHIALGLSGGKDSLTLLTALARLRDFYPHHFSLTAITVDLGNPGFDCRLAKNFCDLLHVPYIFLKTDIARIVFEERKENNPCSLCAKMRKGALNEAALKEGCNKIAYAHHKDDLIETLFLSMLYEGRISTFSPLTHLDKTGLTVIRPLLYVDERAIEGYAKGCHLPVTKSRCRVDGSTKRESVKELLKNIYSENPGARDRIFSAICNQNFEDWPVKIGRYDKIIK